MAVSKKTLKRIRYQLGGALKKPGVNVWRFVFNGVETITGQERKFFIELSALNPYISPDEPVLGFKPRVNISAEDLQNVLAGSASAQKITGENFVIPSYVAVKAGVLGAGAKQLCVYSSIKNIKSSNKKFEVQCGKCSFTEEKLTGRIDIAPSDVQEHPEYFSDSGVMHWELRYEIRKDFPDSCDTKNISWFPVGSRTVFAGSITLDGKEYSVVPKKSCGYTDRFYGKNLVYPWLHLSSSNLTSIISGKTLSESSFAIQGVFDNRLSVVLDFEGKEVTFEADKGKRAYSSLWDFTQVPDNDGEEKLHWTISVHNRKYVLDVDIFCPASQMFVRSFELSEGKRQLLKMLSGGTGIGEIRLYKRIRKNLELIEHAHVANALCEFGQLELPE